jgi:hypothetical protein
LNNIKFLSPIDRDEANRKIRRIIKKLENLGWHPYIQKNVKFYCDPITKNELRLQTNAFGQYHIQYKDNTRRTFSYYFHNTLTKELFQYQNVVNLVCYNFEYNISVRKKLIIFLDPKCVFCGNEDIDLLYIDHKADNGSQDRKWSKDAGVNLFSFYWNNLADAYMNLQILCTKCHILKTRHKLTQSHIEAKHNIEVKQLAKKAKKAKKGSK